MDTIVSISEVYLPIEARSSAVKVAVHFLFLDYVLPELALEVNTFSTALFASAVNMIWQSCFFWSW